MRRYPWTITIYKKCPLTSRCILIQLSMNRGGLSRLARRVVAGGPKFCGAERDRTDDLRLAKPALSQLSYSPVGVVFSAHRVGQGRVELPTSRLSGVRSNHLSYWPQPEPCARVSGWAERLRTPPWLRLLPRLRPGRAERGPRSLETEPYARSSRS